MKRIELLAAKIISQLFERSFENANDYEAMIMKNALGLPKDENLILLSELKVLAKKKVENDRGKILLNPNETLQSFLEAIKRIEKREGSN